MITKTCEVCGETLRTRNIKSKYHHRCYLKFMRGDGNPMRVKSKLHPVLKAKCLLCGERLTTKGTKDKYHQTCYFNHLKGQGNPFYGKKHKLASVEQMKTRKTGNHYRLGKKAREETRQKIREVARKRIGSLNPAWKGGLSFFPYTAGFDDSLKDFIRRMYGNKCYLCQQEESVIEKKTGKLKSLHVHHINYEKDDAREINLIPLCCKCHIKTNTKRDYWMQLFRTRFFWGRQLTATSSDC